MLRPCLLSYGVASRLQPQVECNTSERLYAMVQAVNLRPRIEPPLEEHSFGNLYLFATIIPRLVSGGDEQCGIVKRMRDQISRIEKNMLEVYKRGQSTWISSWSSFQRKRPFFSASVVGVDFLYTKLTLAGESLYGWACRPLTFNNLVVFVDTRSRDGVEAYINLP
ncbi:Transferase [Parasponia andersonii]|uniref:Transferase n=1 Tax=Parasponia andersonii TaxID=3476 RepID=A0A2P5CUK7_PARAD|nr:Transferase [Parasponia andersonii]